MSSLQPHARYELAVRSIGILTGETCFVPLLVQMPEHVPADPPTAVTATFDQFGQNTLTRGKAIAAISITWIPPKQVLCLYHVHAGISYAHSPMAC